MTSFHALYRGDSVSTAQLVTVCADRDLVARFAGEMLDDPDHELLRQTGDPAVDALELIQAETEESGGP